MSQFQLTIFTLLTAFLVSGCVSVFDSDPDREFAARYSGFQYCKVPVVKQSSQRSCGAAVLASVLDYWLDEGAPAEPQLLEKSPPQSEVGYPLLQLRNIARNEGVLAFALTMEADPIETLAEHVKKGRPVIAAVELPKGRYFQGGLPLIETLDRRVMQSPVPTSAWKSHYVVVCGVSYGEVLLMDPQYGLVTTSKTEFEQFWKRQGYAALVCSAVSEEVRVKVPSTP